MEVAIRKESSTEIAQQSPSLEFGADEIGGCQEGFGNTESCLSDPDWNKWILLVPSQPYISCIQ